MRRNLFITIAVGALLMAISQFLPLYHVHVAATRVTFGSTTVGSAHAYSVLLLAALAAFLGASVLVSGNRFALVLTGLLGVVALAIALGHDLSDAHAHGLRMVDGQYVTATNVLAGGLYVEIVGALVLMLATAMGLLFGGAALQTVRPAPKVPVNRQGRRRDSSDRPVTGIDRSETTKSGP